jgi:hypothetical protein
MRIGTLARAHSVVGWLGVFIFLASGVYLSRERPELYGGSEVVRALFRANHLYILAGALLNLLAARVGAVDSLLRTRIRTAGSLALLSTVPLLSAAFWLEPPHGFEGRKLTLLGMVLMLVGTLLVTLTTPKARAT